MNAQDQPSSTSERVFEKWMPSHAPNSQHRRDPSPMAPKMAAMMPSSPFCECTSAARSISVGAAVLTAATLSRVDAAHAAPDGCEEREIGGRVSGEVCDREARSADLRHEEQRPSYQDACQHEVAEQPRA